MRLAVRNSTAPWVGRLGAIPWWNAPPGNGQWRSVESGHPKLSTGTAVCIGTPVGRLQKVPLPRFMGTRHDAYKALRSLNFAQKRGFIYRDKS